MLQKRTGVVKKALLTWGTNVGGLGAIPASPGGFPGRDWVKKRELTHPVASPTPPHLARPASAPQTLLRVRWVKRCLGPVGVCHSPFPILKVSQPSSGHAQSHPQEDMRSPGDTQQTRGRDRALESPPPGGVSGFCDLWPTQGLAGSSLPRCRLSSLQF